MPRSVLVPAAGDAVLVDGHRYRIRTVLLRVVRLVDRESREDVVDERDLRWDAEREAWAHERRS